MTRVLVPFNVAANHLQIADVLSYRNGPATLNPLRWPGWAMGKSIAASGRGDEVHTGLADKTSSGEWMALGMRLARQKLKFLEDEVAANPGLIDVYRVVGRCEWSGDYPYQAHGLPWKTRRAIVDDMRRFALKDHYGWLGVLRSSVYFVPGLRWAAPHFGELADDAAANARPYCSQAVSHCVRKHAFPLLNKRPDRHMLPGDIVTSPLLLELFTLVPSASDPQPIEHYFGGLQG